jgi:hypothetical protein
MALEALPRRIQISKLDHEDPPARAMLGNLQEIDHARKTRPTRQVGRDFRERYLEHFRNEDLSGWEGISTANAYMRALPKPDRAGDLARANPSS